MKTKGLLFGALTVILASIVIFSYDYNTKSSFIPRSVKKHLDNKDVNDAAEWMYKRRANQITGEIDINDVIKANQEMIEFKSKKNSNTIGFNWSDMGPDNVGGRTRAILIDKDNPNLIFAGAVSGGLWKSTTGGTSWTKVTTSSDYWSTINIGSICQTANGDIYVGTGEGFYHNSGTKTGGFEGQGIWKSTDRGATFTHLTSTWTTNTDMITFVNVNKLAAHPTDGNKVYAATKRGLKVTNDGGQTWKALFNITLDVKECTDVKVATDGTVITAIDKKAYISANGDSGTFAKKSASSATTYLADSLINPSVGRLEFAFAPSNPNYIYCSAAKTDGKIENIYRSTDKGNKWVVIGAGGSDLFQPFRNQGEYDNVIAVFPDNPDKVLLGGIDLWKWQAGGMFEQITLWSLPESSPAYVHADIHAIVFHPNYSTNKTLYIGSDGGVSKSTDAALTFSTINKNYNVTQFYAISFSNSGQVMGGTQDNGTQYIDFKGNSAKAAKEVAGGDGGYCHISALSPNIMYASVYNGDVRRSEDYGNVMSSYYNAQSGTFITNFRIWESFNDIYSTDSVSYTVLDNDTLYSGEVITGKSKINDLPLTITYSGLTKYPGEIIKIKDTYQAVLALGLTNKIVFSRTPLSFSNSTTVVSATNIVGTVETLEFSKDGNYLYAGCSNGNLYRIDSLWHLRSVTQLNNTKADLIASFTNRTITSISVDPQNSSNVLVTLGNYGNNEYIYYSTNAATTTTASGNFTSKQGDFPKVPVYSSLILWNDSKKVLIGTEYGIFSCSDITASSATWADESNNAGIANVSVYMLTQQLHENVWLHGVSNHGYIYAGTHGRGIWKSESNKGPVSVPTIADNSRSLEINIYPNPVKDNATIKINSLSNSRALVNIYDVQGKNVYSNSVNTTIGNNLLNVNVSSLTKGTYFVNVNIDGQKVSSKMLVY